MGRLQGKIMIVTGAGSGIGQGAAILAAKEGARLVLADINDKGSQETLAEIAKGQGEAIYVRTDISSEDDVKQLFAETIKAYGRLDVLFNCAGIWDNERDHSIVELDLGVWERVIGVNLRGTFLMCKHGIPHLIASGAGSLINVSSGAAIAGSRGTGAAYTASKGGILSLSRLLAAELASSQVRVNCICPGPVATNLNAAVYAKKPRRTPIGRVGTPEDIAYAVIYLASDEASYVTGATITLDGGSTALSGLRT